MGCDYYKVYDAIVTYRREQQQDGDQQVIINVHADGQYVGHLDYDEREAMMLDNREELEKRPLVEIYNSNDGWLGLHDDEGHNGGSRLLALQESKRTSNYKATILAWINEDINDDVESTFTLDDVLTIQIKQSAR
jgi:hypothetical protein